MSLLNPDPQSQKSPQSSAENDGSFNQERERIHRKVLSSVSHDLKTPLASIIGSLEIYERMKDKLPADRQQALIQVALQEAYRLDSFVTNILDMAKLESNTVKLQSEAIEVGSVIKNCTMRLTNRLKDCTVNINPASGPCEGIADSALLNRVIGLILDNAVKYGGHPPIIDIDFGNDSNQIAFIEIRDNGGGVPDPQMEKIFMKYTRFAKEDQQSAGTGLGLSIGREIMRLLGGDLTVKNNPNGGAIFTMRFPLTQKSARLT